MRENESLSRLIGDIYDAALDPSLWPEVLAAIAGFVGASAGGLFVRDAIHRTGNICYEFGADPAYTQLYFDSYIKLDPLSAAYLVLEPGEVFSNSTMIPQAEFVQSRFYKEWVQPQGWLDNVCVILEKSACRQASLAVFRGERDGLADEAARDRMRLLVPHIRRSVLIGKVMELKDAQAASLADALDGVSAGMFLVDCDGRIVHANASGHAILAEGDVLHATCGRLVAGDPAADRALHDGFGAAGRGDQAVGTKGIAVPLSAGDGERYIAHMLPLTSGARRRAGAACAAVAALFVHKAALDSRSPLETIARQYRLTPMELRVLLAIVEVGGVPEVAEALGIGETTVKTHLGRLYDKTGGHRQADLVKLVAGYSSPLLG